MPTVVPPGLEAVKELALPFDEKNLGVTLGVKDGRAWAGARLGLDRQSRPGGWKMRLRVGF